MHMICSISYVIYHLSKMLLHRIVIFQGRPSKISLVFALIPHTDRLTKVIGKINGLTTFSKLNVQGGWL